MIAVVEILIQFLPLFQPSSASRTGSSWRSLKLAETPVQLSLDMPWVNKHKNRAGYCHRKLGKQVTLLPRRDTKYPLIQTFSAWVALSAAYRQRWSLATISSTFPRFRLQQEHCNLGKASTCCSVSKSQVVMHTHTLPPCLSYPPSCAEKNSHCLLPGAGINGSL